MPTESPNVATKEKGAHTLPADEAILLDVFNMLRQDDAVFSQVLGTIISAASFIAALAGLVLAFGLASLVFPVPTPNSLQMLQSYGFPKLLGISGTHQGPLVSALVSEFLALLIAAGYFVLYPVIRMLTAQHSYSQRGVEFLLSQPEKKREILEHALRRRVPWYTIVLLIASLIAPFLLLVLGALTTLYSVLLHIPG